MGTVVIEDPKFDHVHGFVKVRDVHPLLIRLAFRL